MGRASVALGISETAAQTAEQNFRAAAGILQVPEDMQTILTTPRREVHMQIPLRMDDGQLAVFDAWQVQHNTVRGPSLNALRLDPAADVTLLRALAQAATWSCALLNLPFGGASSGIVCSPEKMSAREMEALTRAFTSRARRLIGVYEEIIAPDLDTPAEVMGWIFDEYSTSLDSVSASVTGKPVAIGGALSHQAALGQGVSIVAREMASLELKGARVIVQGFGAAGRSVARALADLGCVIIGITNGCWALYSQEGIDLRAVLAHPGDAVGTLGEASNAEAIESSELITRECDIFVTAAGDSALNANNAADIRARIILEVSSLSITPAADLVFEQLGIKVIPDILANAGAMIASFIEWEQNLEQKRWAMERTQSEMEAMLIRACRAVAERAQQLSLTLRRAAYSIGVERVARLEKLKGI